MLLWFKPKGEKVAHFVEAVNALKIDLDTNLFPISGERKFGNEYLILDIPRGQISFQPPRVQVSFTYMPQEYQRQKLVVTNPETAYRLLEASIEDYKARQQETLNSLTARFDNLFAYPLEEIAKSLTEMEAVEGVKVQYAVKNLSDIVDEVRSIAELSLVRDIKKLNKGLQIDEGRDRRIKSLQDAVSNVLKYSRTVGKIEGDYITGLDPKIGAKLIASGLAKPAYQNAPTRP